VPTTYRRNEKHFSQDLSRLKALRNVGKKAIIAGAIAIDLQFPSQDIQ
jgi:hypothetical protein